MALLSTWPGIGGISTRSIACVKFVVLDVLNSLFTFRFYAAIIARLLNN